jgi:predicted Zn-dependent protease
MIRKDSVLVIEDVYVSDITESKESYAAITYASGELYFNTSTMDKLSPSKRGQVCTHELGHALGLAHNQSTDVMYKTVTGKYKLSANDKASFKKAYSTY